MEWVVFTFGSEIMYDEHLLVAIFYTAENSEIRRSTSQHCQYDRRIMGHAPSAVFDVRCETDEAGGWR